MPRRFREPEPHLEIIGELAAKHRANDDAGTNTVECCHATDLGDRRIGCLEEHELERIGGGDLLRGHLVPTPVVGKTLDESPRSRCRVPHPGFGRIEGAGEVPP